MALKIAVKTGFDGFLSKTEEGQTVVVNPVSYHRDITTEFGIKDEYSKVERERPGVIAEVLTFDAKGQGSWLGRLLVTQPTVVKNLRHTVGTGEVTIGTFGKQAPKGAGNPYWVIKDMTDAEAALAVAWDAANPDRFTGPQAAETAKAAPSNPVAAIPTQRSAPKVESTPAVEADDDTLALFDE